MPLQIIRQDITKMDCDAIVNPSNIYLDPGGSTDWAIHEAAGPELYEYCRRLGGCPIGTAKISPAFELPSKYIIHTAGPDWFDDENPKEMLVSCYRECLKLAVENKCDSVAFPLISSGTNGFPKDLVLKIAINTISEFLFEHEMMIFLVVFGKQAYEISQKLFTGIAAYIDDRYVLEHSDDFEDLLYLTECYAMDKECVEEAPIARRKSIPVVQSNSIAAPKKPKLSLEEYIKLDKRFAYKLYDLIQAKEMTTVECYKRANVSKQTWHKIETDPNYKPNKKTVISFAVALRLTLDEAQMLLGSVGFVLSNSSLFDVIIMYCLENEVYSVWEIDSILYKYDQETLFSKA